MSKLLLTKGASYHVLGKVKFDAVKGVPVTVEDADLKKYLLDSGHFEEVKDDAKAEVPEAKTGTITVDDVPVKGGKASKKSDAVPGFES